MSDERAFTDVAAPRWDGRSVASLLVLLTCVGAPVAAWLGVSGVRRTAGAVRRGRWCAVIGVVGGVVCSVLLVAGLLLGEKVRGSVEQARDLAVGDCVDQGYGEDAEDSVAFKERSCSSPHDAEVAYRGELTAGQVAGYAEATSTTICGRSFDDPYRQATRTGRYALSLVLLGDPDEPERADRYLCLLWRNDFGPLKHPIGEQDR